VRCHISSSYAPPALNAHSRHLSSHSWLRRAHAARCAVHVPLVQDHESGVLVLDLPTLRQPGHAAAMVAQCEVAYRSLWLLVLATETRGASSRDAQGGDDGASAEVWSRAGGLMAELCASPLKLTMRVATAVNCWSQLQSILTHRAPDPLADALGSSSTNGATSNPSALDDDRDESQHEAFLTVCGLNPWAARRIAEHYSLRDLLGLPHHLRLRHFGWVPERALRVLGFVAEGGEDEEEAPDNPHQPPPQPTAPAAVAQPRMPPAPPPPAPAADMHHNDTYTHTYTPASAHVRNSHVDPSMFQAPTIEDMLQASADAAQFDGWAYDDAHASNAGWR
jgi:hypothetical protein